MTHIDLDAARAARAAARAAAGITDPTFTFAGETFTLPPELPLQFITEIEAEHLTEGFRVLLGDQASAFFALGPTSGDLEQLAEAMRDIYRAGKRAPSPNGGAQPILRAAAGEVRVDVPSPPETEDNE